MSNLKLRLKQLEKSDPVTPLVIIIDKGKYTDVDNVKIKEAENRGQPVKVIDVQEIDSNGEIVTE